MVYAKVVNEGKVDFLRPCLQTKNTLLVVIQYPSRLFRRKTDNIGKYKLILIIFNCYSLGPTKEEAVM